MSARTFILDLVSRGRYCFSAKEASIALGLSGPAFRAALRRLREKGEIAMPYRGFHVIVSPEFRSAGCLPAAHFIPALMEHLGEKYYAGLLSAAEYHGAAHQRPQVFQVVTARNKAGISCGQVRVEFIARKNMDRIPVVDFKTPRGYLRISTPAATAFDLVGYSQHAAGLDHVATILVELSEKMDAAELQRLAELSPIAWAQRLGWLLDLVGKRSLTEGLAAYVSRKKPVSTPLVPSLPVAGLGRDKRWRVLVNAQVEADI
ncbi:MAG: hypothetical protein A4E73_00356 [Syntrophaceae bacterium PtaU1.Bin231]|nr:MAG: hypothetical protein A4E73_00356 [Syntrophaceae bacterium PtaU1.Bin231]